MFFNKTIRKTLQNIFSCFLLFCMVAIFSVPVFAATNVKYIAHRGDMNDAPEESKAAIDKAVENGYKAIECDVWKTKSGDFLVFHDSNLNRLCGVDKSIWNVSAKTRRNYPFKNKKYGTQYILTFSEMLKYAKQKNVDIYFHLKVSTTTFSNSNITSLLKTISNNGMKGKAYVFSSNKSVMDHLKHHASFKTGNLCSSSSVAKLKTVAKRAKKTNKADFVIFKYVPGYTNKKSLINYCHNLGLKVCFYNINKQTETTSMKKLGTDWLILNQPVFAE